MGAAFIDCILVIILAKMIFIETALWRSVLAERKDHKDYTNIYSSVCLPDLHLDLGLWIIC